MLNTICAAEVDDFFNHCDPERENLCLYGERIEAVHAGAKVADREAESARPPPARD